MSSLNKSENLAILLLVLVDLGYQSVPLYNRPSAMSEICKMQSCQWYGVKRITTLSVMSEICEMQSCQWYGVKRITTRFREQGDTRKRVLGTFLLLQVVLTSSIKLISSSISLSLNLTYSLEKNCQK